MEEMSIDIETYSSVDLVGSGVYAYADAPDFEILLFAYAFGGGQINIIDIAGGEKLPGRVKNALTSEDVLKTAYNANFERTCISKFFGMDLPVNQWMCTAVQAAELGLPQTLGGVAEVLGLEERKDKRGRQLINYFCKPCGPTKTNGGRRRNLPSHDTEKWERFKSYCMRDVEVERAIKRKLSSFPIAESERRLWEVDQKINDRGVRIDTAVVDNAIRFNNTYVQGLKEKITLITGINNPNSVEQLKNWIWERTGREVKSLNKESIKGLLEACDDAVVKEVIKLRALTAKSSVSKYEAMGRSVCRDGRVRGVTQFYGANRTGRWAGRIIQPQNLPQNHMADLALARETLASGDYGMFEMLYGDVSHVLSELIRTAIIPSEGRRLIVSDFSAIEARVVAYLAGERWRLEVFRSHGKIYEASAAQMFNVPVESIKKGDPLRQKGKIAELALGYGGGVGALKSMGALDMGLEEEELQPLVDAWRAANPAIVKFWKDAEKAFKSAMDNKPVILHNGVGFIKKSGILFIKLPSGRGIAYVRPRLGINKFGTASITYMGLNQTKKTWERIETFGGKLVENIVQAVARDCLAESIIKLEDKGYEINFHVHDEVIIDAPFGYGSVEEVTNIMSEPVSWAPGLPLRADGYETPFYRKD